MSSSFLVHFYVRFFVFLYTLWNVIADIDIETIEVNFKGTNKLWSKPRLMKYV